MTLCLGCILLGTPALSQRVSIGVRVPDTATQSYYKYTYIQTPRVMRGASPDTQRVDTARRVSVTTLRPSGGPLRGQLARAAHRAAANGRLLLFEAGAEWCGPCKAFLASLSDPQMIQAFTGVTVIRVDVDDWPKSTSDPLRMYGLPKFSFIGKDGNEESVLDWADIAPRAGVTQALDSIFRSIPVTARLFMTAFREARARQSRTSQMDTQPDIPEIPGLVTTIPFDLTQYGYILIHASVDGHAGSFLLDTGSPTVMLYRRYFRPAADGTIEFIPNGDDDPAINALTARGPLGRANARNVQLGKLTARLDSRSTRGAVTSPFVAPAMYGVHPGLQAMGRPVLGFIGVTALIGFDVIIDYRHSRVTFIRVDSVGHRLASVPALTPHDSLPLILLEGGQQYGLHGRIGDSTVTYVLDTGAPTNSIPTRFWTTIMQKGRPAPTHELRTPKWTERAECRTTDQVVVGDFPYQAMTFCHYDGDDGIPGLGYPYLSRHGIVGFNHRTRRLFFYSKNALDGFLPSANQ